jgi:hypothetical protein
MRRLANIRLWASIGALVAAAGMPYCSAALGWAATVDDTSISVRADILAGVVTSWIGSAILLAAGTAWVFRALRRRQAARV